MVYTHPAREGGKLRRSGRENERIIKKAEQQGGEREGHLKMEPDWLHTLYMMKRLRNIFLRTVKNQQPPGIEPRASDCALPPELWPPGDS